MSAKHVHLTKYEKELVTFGYINTNSIHSVPVGINKLCLKYVDEIVYIVIRGKTLKQFFKKKPGEFILNTFKYNNDISFKYELYPNGDNEEGKGFTMLIIVAIFDESIICDLMYHFDIKCHETNTQFQNIGFGQQGFTWNNGALRLSQSIDFKQLTFSIYIDIDWIKYKDININKHWIKPFKMKQNISLKWKIDKELKHKIQKLEHGKIIYCKERIDDKWNFGIQIHENDKPILFATLLRWPYGMKQIHCTLNNSINGKTDGIYSGILLHSANSPFSTLDHTVFTRSGSLTFLMQITINKLIDNHGEIVDIPTNGIITANPHTKC